MSSVASSVASGEWQIIKQEWTWGVCDQIFDNPYVMPLVLSVSVAITLKITIQLVLLLRRKKKGE